jgi:transposase
VPDVPVGGGVVLVDWDVVVTQPVPLLQHLPYLPVTPTGRCRTVAQDLMALYQLTDPVQARRRAETLIADLRGCPIDELARLGRTLHAWRTELCAHFAHPAVSNGPTENLNLKIKNTKRIARGYRKFAHYRLRLLLNHGRIREDQLPTRIRTCRPRFAA